jgi:hypothetical protein
MEVYEAPPAAALTHVHGRSSEGPNDYRDGDKTLFTDMVNVLALA